MVCNNILEAMGNTPIIKLQHMTGENDADILVKFEGLNVGGSIKTRTAYNMIKDAGIEEVDGRRKYNFFSNQLFGLEDALERLVEEYFHPSAKRLDVRKRILLLTLVLALALYTHHLLNQ